MSESLPPAAQKLNSRPTTSLIVVGCALAVLALVLGLAGIQAGIIPAYLGAAALLAAPAIRWRRARPFSILFAACLLGFFLFALLHNLCYALRSIYHGLTVLAWVLGALEVVTFVAAVVICPPGALIGLLGALVVGLKQSGRASPT